MGISRKFKAVARECVAARIDGTPLVSILTPVLNARKNPYLARCIESVLGQTYPRVEHVFADGGSTDGTVEMLAEYHAKYPDRIRYVSQKDHGVGSALKNAYGIARGEIFGWIDSDDVYEPHAVRTAVDFFEQTPEAHFVYGGCNMIDAKGDQIGCFVIKDCDLDEWLNVWHYIVFCATFFTRDVIETVGFVNDLGNDLCFYIRAGRRFTLHRISKTLTSWRLHDDSISLKRAERESSIRKARAREDFYLVLKYWGSLCSPRAMTYYAVTEPELARKLRPYLGFSYPLLKKIAFQVKTAIAVSQRRPGGGFAFPLIKNICRELKTAIVSRFTRK